MLAAFRWLLFVAVSIAWASLVIRFLKSARDRGYVFRNPLIGYEFKRSDNPTAYDLAFIWFGVALTAMGVYASYVLLAP